MTRDLLSGVFALLFVWMSGHPAAGQAWLRPGGSSDTGGATNGIPKLNGGGTNTALHNVNIVSTAADFPGNAATATTASNLTPQLTNWVASQVSGGSTNLNISAVEDVVGTNTPGYRRFDAASTIMSSWGTVLNPVVSTNSLSPGGLRVSCVVFDRQLIKVFFAAYTNAILSGGGVNSGGRIVMARGPTWTTITNYAVVMNRGAPGEWDSGNIGGIRIFRLDNTGTFYAAYFGSTNTTFETGYQNIGLAYSTDGGENWTKHTNNPVLTLATSGGWNDLANQGMVDIIRHRGVYHMFFGGKHAADGDESIGLAHAPDFFGPYTMYAGNPVVEKTADILAEPNVFQMKDGQGWGMFMGQGAAISRDLTNWTFLGEIGGISAVGSLSAYLFDDNGPAALFDDTAKVSLWRPTPPPVVATGEFVGGFNGNGLGLSNVNATTSQLLNQIWKGGSDESDVYTIFATGKATNTGWRFSVSTNTWFTEVPVVAPAFYGSGAALTLDASGFNGNLATTDNTFQEVAQKLDDLTTSGVSLGDLQAATNAATLTSSVNATGALATALSGLYQPKVPTVLTQGMSFAATLSNNVTVYGGVTSSLDMTAQTFYGSGAGLTALPAAQLSGTIPWAVYAASPRVTTNAATLTAATFTTGDNGSGVGTQAGYTTSTVATNAPIAGAWAGPTNTLAMKANGEYPVYPTATDCAITNLSNGNGWATLGFSNSSAATIVVRITDARVRIIGPASTNAVYIPSAKIGFVSGLVNSWSNAMTSVQQ